MPWPGFRHTVVIWTLYKPPLVEDSSGPKGKARWRFSCCDCRLHNYQIWTQTTNAITWQLLNQQSFLQISWFWAVITYSIICTFIISKSHFHKECKRFSLVPKLSCSVALLRLCVYSSPSLNIFFSILAEHQPFPLIPGLQYQYNTHTTSSGVKQQQDYPENVLIFSLRKI